jgi:hypothetical protein
METEGLGQVWTFSHAQRLKSCSGFAERPKIPVYNINMKLATLAVIFLLIGCASNDHFRLADPIDSSNAEGDAFAGDGLTYDKSMPKRGKTNPNFFTKRCGLENDGLSFVSKRSYACSDAY